MIVAGKLLLAMRRVIGVIEVKHNGGGRLWVAGDEVVDQRAREPVEILAVDAVFKPGKGRGTRQVLRGLQGGPFHTERQQGACRRLWASLPSAYPAAVVETLGQEVLEWRSYRGLMSLVLHSGGEAFGEANLAVDATQQEGAKVG